MTPSVLLFNPSRLETQELEATFVGRQSLLERLEQDLLRDRESQTSRHWLLIGLRGMGKSHLVELLTRRMHDKYKWDIVRMPEEHYQVASLADLLEQIVMRLNDGPSPFADEGDPERVELRAIDLLSKRESPLLVVIENLGSLLEKLSDRDQHRLRELLMLRTVLTLVATAPGLVEGATDHDSPFYDFFHTLHLEELTREEVQELVKTRIRRDGTPQLLEELGRFDALYHFAGGNPRLALALYGVLQEGVTDTFYNQMLELLDRITPYYQARLSDVSPQMRRVLTEMALAEGPLTPAEIAHRTRLKTNQVTANMTKLEQERLVRAAGRPDKRRRYYEVVDRLFRIWLQMREDRSSRNRFRFLAEFYAAYYEGRPEAARQFAEYMHLQHWKGISAGDVQRAREAVRTLEHLAPALGLRDEDVRAEEELMELERKLATTTESAEREALALELVEGWDRLGRAERAFPALSEAVLKEGVSWRIWGWYVLLVFELGRLLSIKRLELHELSEQMRITENFSKRDRRDVWLILRIKSFFQPLAILEILRGERNFIRRMPTLLMVEHSMQGEQGFSPILDFLARGYRGVNMAGAILVLLPSLFPATREKLVAWLGEHARDWPELQAAMSVTTGPQRLDTYALLRTSGYFPEPIAPFESALHVRDAPDRDAALAALHPEEREAVLLILEAPTPGTDTSTPSAGRTSP